MAQASDAVHPASRGFCCERPCFLIAIGHLSDALKTPGGHGGPAPPAAAEGEGLNNEAKLAARKTRGVRTFEALEVDLYHALRRLAGPTLAHRFS